jgi:hypothetical protein
MLPTISAVAAALDAEPHEDHRSALDALALSLLRLGILRWEIAHMRALLCRRTLDTRPAGGDDDQRDAVAA